MVNDITPTPTRQVFLSPIVNLRLVRYGGIEQAQSGGRAVNPVPSLVYEFDDGYLVIDDERRGEDTRYFQRYGGLIGAGDFPEEEAIARNDGEEPKPRWLPAEEWLRNHRLVHEAQRGFSEIQPMAPNAEEELGRITELALSGDVKGLTKLYKDEEAGWNREQVLSTITLALEKIEESKVPA